MSKWKKPKVKMPRFYYEADEDNIRKRLLSLSFKHREKAVREYSLAFKAAYDKEEVEHKKTNKGRFAANSKLRVFTEKCQELYAKQAARKAEIKREHRTKVSNNFGGF